MTTQQPFGLEAKPATARVAVGVAGVQVIALTHQEWLRLKHEWHWQSAHGVPLAAALAAYAVYCARYGGTRPARVWLVQMSYRIPR